MRLTTDLWMACCIFLLVVLLAGNVSADVPRKINYQGRLRDADSGEPIAGSQAMVFRLYDAADGGVQLWAESRTVQVDSAGIFSVILGETSPIGLSFEGPAWLEVEVGGEVLGPRREIVSVPFAFRAMECDSLDGVASEAIWTAVNDGAGSGLDADMLDGLDAEAFADSGHLHDDRYVHRDSLGMPGLLNDFSNPVDWTRLKGVPGPFADGNDDVGAADGYSLDAADGDPVDAVYVDEEGYVGVGTPSPAERLHLAGPESRILLEAASSDPEIGFAATVDTPDEVWRIYKDRGSGDLRLAQDGDRMSVNFQTGNVGIGTVTAGDKLVVEGSVSLAEHLKIDGSTVLSVDGTANTLLGNGAGATNSGSSNTFIGEAAGYSNGLGLQNVFVGDSTGLSNTEGFYNVFVGHRAGYHNTVGQDNVFVGARAGRVNDDGHWNTFVGAHSGQNSEGGTSNTALGSYAGSGIVSGSDNTLLGQGAGHGVVSGGSNVCVGYLAGQSVDGTGNVYIGSMAGVGLNEPGSDKLCIANGPESTDVLIFGDFSAGTLGLGTLHPSSRLHLSSPTSNFGMLRLENSNPGDNEASIGFRPGRDATGADTWVAGVGAWGETGDFVIGIAEPRMVVTPTGQVGIGTVNPGNRLEVHQPSSCWVKSEAEGGVGVAGFALRNDNTGWEIDLRGDMSDILGFMHLGLSPVAYMAIDTQGDVGIGTDAPERKLHIKGNNPRILVESMSGAAEINFKHTLEPSSEVWAIYKEGTTDDLRFYQNGDRIWVKGSSGNVGIGGDPGANKLYVNGTACGTSSWGSCSDVRLKRDIEDVVDAVGKVKKLRGVSFLWRRGEYPDRSLDAGRHYGVVAQEVETVLPEVVREGPDGDRAVAYAEIIPVLIEAIKAQQQEIENLEGRLAELESRSGGRR